jgi:hypothetical protein
MMKWVMAALSVGLACSAPSLRGQEYTVEVINEPAPADELSADVAAQLAQTGVRVLQDGTRAVWEIWPAKRWQVETGFEPTAARLYPFVPGELIGVARLPRRGADFRDQTLGRGVYTLRYALQPIDGNHVGTSPTRDFFLLLPAGDDPSPAPLDTETMQETSAKAAGSSHPAMICLQKLGDDAQPPAVRLLENQEWWVLRLAGTAGDDGKPLSVDLVVVGHAAE